MLKELNFTFVSNVGNLDYGQMTSSVGVILSLMEMYALLSATLISHLIQHMLCM